MNRPLHIFTLAIVILAVCGCAKDMQVQKDLDAYQARLESFTQLPLANKQAIDLQLNMPSKVLLAESIEPINIKLREFYAFKECRLNTLIAQRNTALGKLQLPSGRFVYEKALIHELERCVLLLDESNTQALIEKLHEWKRVKLAQLPSVWSNFITQSSEIYLHMSAATGFITGLPEDNFHSSKQAIQYVMQSLQNPHLASVDLEAHLQVLEHSRLTAKIWRTQLLLAQSLDNISPLLVRYMAINTCSNKQQEDDIVIMRNIFTLFFADKLQPLAAELNKYHYQLAPILTPLIDNPHLPALFRQHIDQHLNVAHEQYKNSMQRHIKLWQQIFARCE